MPEFPENDIIIFPTYSLADGQKTHQQVVQDVRWGLPTEGFIPQFTPNGVEINDGARAINNARKHLQAILQPISTVAEKFEESYVHMVRYKKSEFGLALGVLAGIAPPATTSAEVLSDALRRSGVQWEDAEFPEPHLFVLEGYSGPDINPAFRELLISDTEAKFRLALLKAECHFGLREFDTAIEQYSSALRDLPNLTSDRRKFLALRCGFAFLAKGDALFREFRNPNTGRRAEVTAAYAAAIRVVTENGVAPENPLHKQIIDYAAQQQAKLSGRFNVLGFRDSIVPVQRFRFLEEEVRRLIGLARTSVNNFRQYLEKANALEDLEEELNLQLETAQTNVQTTAQRLSIASARGETIDNQLSSISAKEDFLTAQTAIQGTASALSTAAAAAASTANPVGVVVGAVLGLTALIVNFAASREELDRQKKQANTERTSAGLELSIARQENTLALSRRNFIQDQLTITGGRFLNKARYFALANTYEQLTESYVDEVIRLGYLYERAVAFFLGKPDIQHIRFEYRNQPTGILAGPDELEKDVERVAGELREPNLPKRDLFTDIISLRQAYPIEWSQFLQTGRLDFVVSLYDRDKFRPGSYQQRIKSIRLDVKGLVPPTGFGGTLTHQGRFVVRDRNSTLDANRLFPTDEQLTKAFEQQAVGQLQNAAVGGVIFYDLGPDTKELSIKTVDTGSAQTTNLVS